MARFGARFDLIALEADVAQMAATTLSGEIVWVNAAWRSFARENGGDPASTGVGANYFSATRGALARWLETMTRDCSTSGAVFETEYQCSSPTQRRDFRMRVHPIAGTGFLITHSLLRTTALESRAGAPIPDDAYVENGLVTMCSNCRRARRADHASWDWIPEWVAHPPRLVSHGICPVCVGFYWPENA